MPRINIVEKDETLTTATEQLYNVVYIPGFSSNASMPIKTPKLYTSYSAFTGEVGTSPATFALDVTYDSVGVWGENAKTTSGIMFKEDEADPSYIYASELLKQGIPVVYEKINAETSVSKEISPSVGNPPASESQVGFITNEVTYGQTDTPEQKYTKLHTAPTTLRGNEYCVGKEICINYADNGGESDDTSTNYDYALFRYLGPDDPDDPTKGVWEEIYKNYKVTWSSESTPSINKLTVYGISPAELYAYLKNVRFNISGDAGYENILLDRNYMQIKYLTTGGYPVFEYDGNSIVSRMLNFADPTTIVSDTSTTTTRGDCIVLIDHTNNPERDLVGDTSVLQSVNNSKSVVGKSWAAMFSPWFLYSGKAMPGSFAYLMSMSESVKTNPNWLAIAGVNRGVIPGATGLATGTNIMTRAIADSYMTWGDSSGSAKYTVFINPITNIRPYGLTIWGNRTLEDTIKRGTDKALYYLNMRSMVAEIKKACYAASEQLMFEQNSDVLWINFKSKIVPLLDQMASSYGISGYKIVKETPDNKHQLKATIKIFPIYAVEDFDITVVLTNDDEVVVEEAQ